MINTSNLSVRPDQAQTGKCEASQPTALKNFGVNQIGTISL